MSIVPTAFLAVVDIDDSDRAGLYPSIWQQVHCPLPAQTSTGGFPFALRLVQPSNSAAGPWQDVDSARMTGAVIQVTAGIPGSPPVAGTNDFTLQADGFTQNAVIQFNTEGMLAAFASGNPSRLDLTFQIDVQFAEKDYFQTVFRGTIPVYFSIFSAGAVLPFPPLSYAQNLSGVTSRTGSDATALNHLATVGRAPGQLFSFTETATGLLTFFRLKSGAAAGGDANQIAPLDYSGTTNNVHFALEAVTSLAALGADTPAARNTAIATALDALTSASPVQPIASWLRYDAQALSDPTSDLDLTVGPARTYVGVQAVQRWLRMRTALLVATSHTSEPVTLTCAGQAISNVEDILDGIADDITLGNYPGYGGSFTLEFRGGTNASVGTAHQDATVTIQLPPPVPGNAGEVLSLSPTYNGVPYGNLAIIYDTSIPLSASSLSQDGPDLNGGTFGRVIRLGVQASPTMAALCSRMNVLTAGTIANPFYPFAGATINSDGSFGPAQSADEADYPVACVGPAVTATNPGVIAAALASVATIQAYNGGSHVYTNPA